MSESLRTILLIALLGLLALIGVSSATLETARGNTVWGAVGRVALSFGSFPALVYEAAIEAGDILSGRERDKWLSVPAEDRGLSRFRPVASEAGVTLDGLRVAGTPAPTARGWRLLGGAFLVDGVTQHAAILLDPDLTARRVWMLDEDFVSDGTAARSSRKIIHGLQMLPDGGIVAAFDDGSAVQKRDACGELVWSQIGTYHHMISYDRDRNLLWTLRIRGSLAPQSGANAGLPPLSEFVAISPDTGEIVQHFAAGDVIAANRDAAFLEIPRIDPPNERENSRDSDGVWMVDPFHFNDVDPLPASLAAAFPDFEAGDLLVSARTLNSVFVIDPDTLEVKWHRTGDTLRQHDPDWLPDGRISVYNNRMNRDASRIEAITPGAAGSEILLDGAPIGFYTRIRGKHQHGPDGGLHVVSPQQAWAFEVDKSGAVTLEFVNLGRPETGRNLVMTEFLWFPESEISLEDTPCGN